MRRITTNQQVRAELLHALQLLESCGIARVIPDPDSGICTNLRLVMELSDPAYELFEMALRHVVAQHQTPCMSVELPIEGNWFAYKQPGKWEGVRGYLRHELIRSLINEVTQNENLLD